nr:MAG TPA: hypothetical protein [Caudoviricetes sp.]
MLANQACGFGAGPDGVQAPIQLGAVAVQGRAAGQFALAGLGGKALLQVCNQLIQRLTACGQHGLNVGLDVRTHAVDGAFAAHDSARPVLLGPGNARLAVDGVFGNVYAIAGQLCMPGAAGVFAQLDQVTVAQIVQLTAQLQRAGVGVDGLGHGQDGRLLRATRAGIVQCEQDEPAQALAADFGVVNVHGLPSVVLDAGNAQLGVFELDGHSVQLGFNDALTPDVVFAAHVLQRQVGPQLQHFALKALPLRGLLFVGLLHAVQAREQLQVCSVLVLLGLHQPKLEQAHHHTKPREQQAYQLPKINLQAHKRRPFMRSWALWHFTQRVHPGTAQRRACGIGCSQSWHSVAESVMALPCKPALVAWRRKAVSRWRASRSWARSMSSVTGRLLRLARCRHGCAIAGGRGLGLGGGQRLLPALCICSCTCRVALGRWWLRECRRQGRCRQR